MTILIPQNPPPNALARLSARVEHALLQPPDASAMLWPPTAALEIRVPQTTPFVPASAVQLASTLFGLHTLEALEIRSQGGRLTFHIVVPWSTGPAVRSAILAAAPRAMVALRQSQAFPAPPFAMAIGSMAGRPWGPLHGLTGGRAPDALNPLLQALASIQPGEACTLQILLRPSSTNWASIIQRATTRKAFSPLALLAWARWPAFLLGLALAEPKPRFDGAVQRLCDDKLMGPFAEALMTFGFWMTARRVQVLAQSIVMALSGLATPLNQLDILPSSYAPRRDLQASLSQYHFNIPRGVTKDPRLLVLSPNELAALWHLPSEATTCDSVAWAGAASLMATSAVVAQPREPYLVLGTAARPEGRRVVVLLASDRRGPLLTIGATGVGKSCFMENLGAQDLKAGRGVALLDVHGDMTPHLLGHIPRQRVPHTVVIDTSRPDGLVGLNVLALSDKMDTNVLVGELVGVFRQYFGDLWSVGRMEDTMRALLWALASRPGCSLADAGRVFLDPVFRQQLTQSIANPVVREFWQQEYPRLSAAQQQERSSVLLNKIRAFLTNDVLRAMLTAPSCLDVRRHLDDGGILFLRPTGLPEAERALLVGLVTALLFVAARSRADTAVAARRPCFLYLDEAQTVTSPSLAAILSQGRKFGLMCGGLALQYLDAMDVGIRQALLGNASTLVVFRCGPGDARLLQPALAPLDAAGLENLDRYQAVCKMQRGGVTMPPFGLDLPDPLPEGSRQIAAEVMAASHQRFGLAPREEAVDNQTAQPADDIADPWEEAEPVPAGG